MSPKSGRFKQADMTSVPVSPPERFRPTDRRRILAALPGRFTLDDAHGKSLKTGYCSLPEVEALLEYFLSTGDIERDGLMHFRRTKLIGDNNG
jgi:hypothetical protein